MQEMHPNPLHRFISVIAQLQPLPGKDQASGSLSGGPRVSVLLAALLWLRSCGFLEEASQQHHAFPDLSHLSR